MATLLSIDLKKIVVNVTMIPVINAACAVRDHESYWMGPKKIEGKKITLVLIYYHYISR